MALIKTRPDVRLLLPRPLVGGQEAEFVVEIDCPEPVPVDAITLSFLGEVVWFTTSQYGRHRHSSSFVNHHVPLLGEQTELAAGKHRLQTRFGLGAELPSSWEGDRLAIEYRARVHVDIPWWPDKRADFVLRVSGAGPPEIEGEIEGETAGEKGPVVYVSRVGGPPAKGPYLELSLGQRGVRPAGLMRLSAALGNVDRNRYRKLQLELIAEESLPAGLGGSYVHEYRVGRWTVAVDEHPDELQPIPFSVELPARLAPAFELHGCKLRWLLVVNADVAWGIDPKLRLPIHVVPPQLGSPGELAAPLAVGSDRLRLLWTKIGERAGLELVEDRLRGLVDGVGIVIHRVQGEEGPQVIALLEFPSLGAGLHPHRRRRGLLAGLDTGLAARDEGQTRALLEQLGPSLENAGELLEAEDEHLRLALDGAGLEPKPLEAFVTSIVGLARALAALELPAPASMAAHLGAWEAAADALRGQLRRADLCLSCERDELRLEIGCDFDDEGQLRSTHLELDPGQPIPSRLRLEWTGDAALPEHELPLAELLAPPTWADEPERIALHIEHNLVRILLPAPLPDPRLERGRVDALLAIGRRLRGRTGPYR